MIHFDLDAVQRNGYWEAVGAAAGEDRDPAESAEAHEATVVPEATSEYDSPWGPGVSLEDAPF